VTKKVAFIQMRNCLYITSALTILTVLWLSSTRMSKTHGNTGNLLKFKILSRNADNLLVLNCFSWKCLAHAASGGHLLTN